MRPTPARRRALVALALGVALLLVAGCGIPTDSEPRVITAESTTTAPPASDAGPPSSAATIYLSTPTNTVPDDDADLVAVPRNLDGSPTPTTVLEALFEGPTQEERDRNLLSLIPQDTTLLASSLQGDRLTVELSEEWSSLLGPDQLGAYAQVVLSVTELPTVRTVRFRVDGEPIDDAPTDGDPKSEVTRADYAGLAPEG